VRRKALLQAVVAGMAAVLLGLAPRHRWAATSVGSVAVWFLASGLWLPHAYRAVDRWLSRLAQAVGTAIAWVVLVPFFYLCFVPGRLLLALLGKDPLCRRRTDERTYWSVRPKLTSPDQFRKQY
jgi:hypothetical protein